MVRSDLPRILLVDDHRVVRLGYRHLLESLGYFAVAGEAASGKEALVVLPDLKPDLAIVDISMKEMDGIELTRRIKRDHPDVRVLVVSMHDGSYHIRQALAAGADGYVLKNNIDTVMEEAVDAVLAGKRYLCKDSRKLVAGE